MSEGGGLPPGRRFTFWKFLKTVEFEMSLFGGAQSSGEK